MSTTQGALNPVAVRELEVLSKTAIPIQELRQDDFRIVRQAIGSARVVLMGEETHGTEEFYQRRADLTKALIAREGFTAVLCEADFPAFYDLNRFIGGAPLVQDMQKAKDREELRGPSTVEEAMQKLKDRFPVWMWRNEVIKDLTEWLRDWNHQHGPPPVMLLGLDIYSMFASADEVIKYLDQVDADLARMARHQYSTLGTFRPEAADYCRAVYTGKVASQAPRVAQMLATLNSNELRCTEVPGDGGEFFGALQNARVVGAAEEYYRNSFMGGHVTWNIRDSAMVDMIGQTLKFQEKKMQQMGIRDRSPRVIVWAHNSHVGDALATEHHEQRQFNVGRLVRQRFGMDDSFIIGFSTYTGSVRAARQWNGRDYVMDLNESLPLSTGSLLHQVAKFNKQDEFALISRSNSREIQLTESQRQAREILCAQRLERFVGVQYIKRSERQSHYSYCKMGEQFDMVIHIDETSAVKPLFAPLPRSVRPGTIDYRRFENFDESGGEEDEDIQPGTIP